MGMDSRDFVLVGDDCTDALVSTVGELEGDKSVKVQVQESSSSSINEHKFNFCFKFVL